MRPRIAVIGATGTIGRAVTSELQAGGSDVVAISRTGAVRADLTVPATLDSALRGVDTVFLVWPAPAQAAPAAIERIAQHAKRLVLLTAPHKTAHPFFQQPNPLATMMAGVEALIEASPLQWTFLRPGMFASNSIAWWAPQIRAGNVVRWPYGQAATAPIDERDVAAVAARVLLDDGHAGGDYVLTGPESLTQKEQVEIIGEVLARHLVFEEISPAESGLPDMLLNAWASAVGIPAFVTNTVAEIIGRQPHTLREWATRNRELIVFPEFRSGTLA